MGKKVIWLIFLFVTMYSFGQDMYMEKIKWKEHVDSVSCTDTCDIVLTTKQKYRYQFRYFTKMLTTIRKQSFYCIFVPYGSGIPWWSIFVYEKENEKWNLVAQGSVVRPVCALTARISSNNNEILFFTVPSSCVDQDLDAIRSMVEVEEIGKLTFSDL